MKSRIAHDVVTSSRTRLSAGDVDANVSEALATGCLHHHLSRTRIGQPVHQRGVFGAKNRKPIACFDREAEASTFQRALEPASITSSGHRARAHERFGNHATEHVQ